MTNQPLRRGYGGRPRKLTPEQHRNLLELKAEGISAMEIAAYYQVNLNTVYAYLQKAVEETGNHEQK